MPSLAEIKRQIEKCPGKYIFWTEKEIRALPEILEPEETIKAVTSGLMDNSTWLAVCTDRRIIFLNRGMIYGLRQVQFPLERIQSIDHEFTLIFGSISVWDGASSFSIRMVLKYSIMPFVKATEEAMHQSRQAQGRRAAAATPHSAASQDIASQLMKLAELKEKGYLTDAEFEQQKKKLLG